MPVTYASICAQSIPDFPPNLENLESEIVDAVSESEECIRGKPVENCKLLYFNLFEFLDHTGFIAEHSTTQALMFHPISNRHTAIVERLALNQF